MMCRRLWYTGFGNSLRNYSQMEYNNLCINKLLLERNIWKKGFNTMTQLTGSTISAKKSQYGTEPSTKKDVTMESTWKRPNSKFLAQVTYSNTYIFRNSL
jgi:hypothetical protein